MSDLTIIVSSISPGQNNKVRLDCLAYVAPNHGPIPFVCEHNWGEISVNINKSIRDMAVVECEAQNLSVNPQDKKTIYGGPIDANA